VEVQALQEATPKVLCEFFAQTQTLPLEARCSVSSLTWITGFRWGRLSSLLREHVDGLRGSGRRGWCRPCSRRGRDVWLLQSPLPLLRRRRWMTLVLGLCVGVALRGGLVRLFLFMGSHVISLYSSFTLRRSVLSLWLFLFPIVLFQFRCGAVRMIIDTQL
jgi:hypothetical protein